jgi:pSer/pThr/pTyr-binding forkhead associated (FHA) protein
MKSPPIIVVQLVHIQGPLKGEIQEFSDPVISIGRHPSGHVCFPKDLTSISRKHTEIKREGNRFMLIDHSTNGTFVNGKRVQEAYLKDGDVLTFAEDGPKISFLTKVMEGQPDIATAASPSTPPEIQSVSPSQIRGIQTPGPPRQSAVSFDNISPAAQADHPQPSHAAEIPVQRVQVPLIIQYGPTLRSFKELPVTIGKSPSSDFTLDHPGILDRHAEIFFAQDQYWVKDLTGQKMLSVNGQPVHIQAPVTPNDSLALSPHGPNFRFLGGGRLAEIEEPLPEQPMNASRENAAKRPQERPTGKEPKGAKAIFKKFLRR